MFLESKLDPVLVPLSSPRRALQCIQETKTVLDTKTQDENGSRIHQGILIYRVLAQGRLP